ncbi:MAG: hypothetical protein AB1782_12595 [Cyanobacteriota bacterium]
MKITFEYILKIYLVLLMVISLLYIIDRVTETTSKPVLIKDQIKTEVFVIKKGKFFPYRFKKL